MATDLSAEAIIRNFSNPFIQKRYRKDGVTEANLFKLCRAVSNGFHAETGRALDDLAPQRFDLTAEQGFLDNRALFWNAPRKAGQSDEDTRLGIGQVKLKKWGVTNIDEMVDLLANLLRTTPAQIGWSENVDEDGEFEPCLVAFNISPAIFTALGITDVAGAIERLEADLDDVAPAGVRVRLESQGTALWDDSGTLWDDSGTWSEGTDPVGSTPPAPPAPPDEGGMGDGPIGEDPIG